MKRKSILLVCLCLLIGGIAVWKIAEPAKENEIEPTVAETVQEEILTEETHSTLPFVEIPEDEEEPSEPERESTEPTIAETVPNRDPELGENDTDWVEIID